METELQQFEWDISWEPYSKQDCIFIDNDSDRQVYLTEADLLEMLETLRGLDK